MKKVCLLSLALGVILMAFPNTATSLRCFKCLNAKKEPFQDAGCSTIQNCTGAENSCMIRVYRYTESLEPQSFELSCRAEVDCRRLGVGCQVKSDPLTTCTHCCNSSLCNSPTTFKVTTVPPTSGHPQILPLTVPPTSGHPQILPLTSTLVALAVLCLVAGSHLNCVIARK